MNRDRYRRVRRAIREAEAHADRYRMKRDVRQAFVKARRRRACREIFSDYFDQIEGTLRDLSRVITAGL